MSNSYKKNPICKDNNSSKKWAKRQANGKVRRYLKNERNEFRTKSKDYRKVYNSWDINDYVFKSFFENVDQYVEWNLVMSSLYSYWREESVQDLKNRWYKSYKRK